MKLAQASRTLESGVDWLTVTTRSNDVGLGWHQIAINAAEMYWGKKFSRKDWSFYGYVGFEFDGIRWGYNPKNETYILQTVGDRSRGIWQKIDLFKEYKVTRIDLQVTVTTETPTPKLPETAYNSLCRPNNGLDGRRMYSMWKNSKGGKTLYIGSRSSEVYCRLYDKGVQGGIAPEGTLYRYEVELSGKRAIREYARLIGAVKHGTHAGHAILSMVYQAFQERGVIPIFPNNDVTVEEVSVQFSSSTMSKLKWLRSQVRKSVQELIQNGQEDELIDALGLKTLSIFEEMN